MSRKTLVHTILSALAILVFSLLYLVPVATMQEKGNRSGVEGVETTNGESPVILSIVVKPGKLKKNELNKIKLIVKFQDKDKDLYGGTLELTITESNWYSRDYSFALDSSKFNKKKGKGKFVFHVLIGNCKKAKFDACLKDAAENTSKNKFVKVKASGKKGPRWGIRLKELAKDFKLYDKDGNLVSLHDFYGKVILLDISTMWCGPCKAEASDAEELYQKYKKYGFVMINVLFENENYGPVDQSDCARWVKTYKMTFPVLADVNKLVWYMFAETGYIPLNLVIDLDMVIRFKETGYYKENIENKIRELLGLDPL